MTQNRSSLSLRQLRQSHPITLRLSNGHSKSNMIVLNKTSNTLPFNIGDSHYLYSANRPWSENVPG